MSANALEKGRTAFKVEAVELLEELETSLLTLEENPDDNELIGQIFRAMHTIKGSGGMFGFEKIETFTHDIETVFDKVREGKIKVTQHLIDITLAACDVISQLLILAEGDIDLELDKRANSILATFKKYSSDMGMVEELKHEINDEDILEFSDGHKTTYLVTFEPNSNILSFGTNPLLLLSELCSLGESFLTVHPDKIPILDKIDPEQCYLSWQVLLTTDSTENEIQDIFIFVEDDCKLTISILDREGLIKPENDFRILGTILQQGEKITKKRIKALIDNRPSEVSKNSDSNKKITKIAPKAGDSQKKNSDRIKKKAMQVSSIRVSAEKLDQLVNLVGELVIVQASLTQRVQTNQDALMLPISEEIERLTRDLRDTAMNIRMVPIGTLFSKFKRLVRDLARDQKKVVDFITVGDDIELDKNVIEQLNDPMVHLIRNSVDHGIEVADIRMACGKNNHGRITLSAYHSGADVIIEIEDDGKGLDPELLRKKGVEKGLIAPETRLTDKESFRLIFEPGFSTAEKVSAVSGRGVGMDVVRRNIEDLRGTINIESLKGKGTVIKLRLPLTLGIIEGLLVRIAEDHFVLPLLSIEDCLERPDKYSKDKKELHTINVRGEIVPVIVLRTEFGIDGESPELEHVVISRIGEQRIGLIVDEIIGEQQVVIKSLGRMYKDIEGLSGATILGDGTVALILDVQRLVEKVIEAEESRLDFSIS